MLKLQEHHWDVNFQELAGILDFMQQGKISSSSGEADSAQRGYTIVAKPGSIVSRHRRNISTTFTEDFEGSGIKAANSRERRHPHP